MDTGKTTLDSLVTSLLDRVSGNVATASQPNYGEVIALYPHMGSPAVVVRPRSAGDVAEAIRFARVADLPVSVRSGGHGGPVFGTYDGQLVIDVRELNAVTLDGDGIVHVGAGATWGEVADTLGDHGLVLTSGDTASVGVGGLTLGGGIGWLVRSHGLVIDSLVGADVVTASGQVLECDADNNSDLFWAIRGGGGNFGVITEFRFHPVPLGGIVGGRITLGTDTLDATIRQWRDAMRSAPEALNSTLVVMPAFGDAPGSAEIVVCYGGTDEAAAREAIAPLTRVAGVRGTTIAPMRYRDLLEEPEPPDAPVMVVPHNAFTASLTDDVVSTTVGVHAAVGGVLMLRFLAGAFNRVPADATAFGHRGAEALVIAAAFLPVDAAPETITRVSQTLSALDGHSIGAYSNFSYEPGERTTSAAYPAHTLTRLRALKRRYDPDNLFRRNHNIVPEADAAEAGAAPSGPM